MKGSSVVGWLRSQGFLVEYCLLDFNNVKKIWESSLILTGPFTPRFKDEDLDEALFTASAAAATSSGEFTYTFVDTAGTPAPMATDDKDF